MSLFRSNFGKRMCEKPLIVNVRTRPRVTCSVLMRTQIMQPYLLNGNVFVKKFTTRVYRDRNDWSNLCGFTIFFGKRSKRIIS